MFTNVLENATTIPAERIADFAKHVGVTMTVTGAHYNV